MLTAVYLSEYGADESRDRRALRRRGPALDAVDRRRRVHLGGRRRRDALFSAIAGAIALTVLMWPIITRATEEMLRLVPNELREAALALGVPRWKMVLRIVIPTAGAGILTAVMLAVARGLGETAPDPADVARQRLHQHEPAAADGRRPAARSTTYAQSAFSQWQTLAWGGAISAARGRARAVDRRPGTVGSPTEEARVRGMEVVAD